MTDIKRDTLPFGRSGRAEALQPDQCLTGKFVSHTTSESPVNPEGLSHIIHSDPDASNCRQLLEASHELKAWYRRRSEGIGLDHPLREHSELGGFDIEAMFKGEYFFTDRRIPLKDAIAAMQADRAHKTDRGQVDLDFGCGNAMNRTPPLSSATTTTA